MDYFSGPQELRQASKLIFLVAKQWNYDVQVRDAIRPKKIFSHRLNGEKDICKLVDNFFEHHNPFKMNHFTFGIWSIQSNKISKVYKNSTICSPFKLAERYTRSFPLSLWESVMRG